MLKRHFAGSLFAAIAIAIGCFSPLGANAADVDTLIVDTLIKALGSDDAIGSDDRYEAANSLAAHAAESDAAVKALVAALESDDAGLRWRAARALAAAGPNAAPAVGALAKQLKDKNPVARAHAANALGTIGDAAKDAVGALAAAIADPDARVRREAVETLRAIKPDRKVMRPLILKVLEDADPAVAILAVEALAENGKESVVALIEAINDEKTCYWACLVVQHLGPDAVEAVDALTAALSHKKPHARMNALLALAKIGPAAKKASPTIVKRLKDKQMGVRFAAAFALGQLGATEASDALRATVKDKDPFLSLVACWSLAKIHPDDKKLSRQARHHALQALGSNDAQLRAGGVRALSDLGSESKKSIAAIGAALGDPSPSVVGNAMEALVKLGPAAVPVVAEQLENKDARDAAVAVLGKLESKAAKAVGALIKATSDDDARFRSEAAMTLGLIGPQAAEAVPALAQLLTAEDEQVRVSATFALAKIGPQAKAAISTLRKGLASGSTRIKTVSAWALYRISPDSQEAAKAAVPLLTAILSSDRERARVEGARALGDMGALAKSARAALVKLAEEDESADVRSAAKLALKKIGN